MQHTKPDPLDVFKALRTWQPAPRTWHPAPSAEHSALFYLSDAASFVASAMTALERTKSGSDAQRLAKALPGEIEFTGKRKRRFAMQEPRPEPFVLLGGAP